MMDVETSNHTLRAMLHQEETCYTVEDYFQRLPQETSYGLPVDESARQQIGQWCINIMDACSYTRETASMTMSCLDRFVATPEGHQALVDRNEYQLAALTAVYLTVKVHCPQALSPDLVASLSQGSFTREDVETMERRMLHALQWRVNPPTIMDFVRLYLDLVPTDCLDQHARNVVVELAGYQADLSILEFEFATAKPSHVAFASLLNAVESVYKDDFRTCDSIAELVACSTDINHRNIRGLRSLLYGAITEQVSAELLDPDVSGKSPIPNKRMHRASFVESPKSVFDHHHSHRLSYVLQV
jgi:hypothetical protein